MALKDDIINKVAGRTELNKEVVEAIVAHQFTSVLEKMTTEYSIELSGFGTFLFLPIKAKRITNILKETVESIPSPETPADRKKVENAKKDIISINNRLNHYNAKHKTNSGGVEECSDKE